MTGDKPDPRIRTPMQWTPGPAAGFTTGTPWETLQPDTATVNVTVEDTASGSMLNLYRSLIHARRASAALTDGRLTPLASGDSSVAAYLRQSTGQTVLVVVNLASAGKTVTIDGGPLAAGRYASRDLLGTGRGTIVVGPDRRLAALSLDPRSALVLELIRK